MFECGLEGIKLKIVKRSQFEKGENGQGENETEVSEKDNISKSQDDLNNTAGMKELFLIIIFQKPLEYNITYF